MLSNISRDAVGPIDARLMPGERLLWRGQPDRRVYTFGGPWYLIPFSVMWAGFAFVWEGLALTSGAPPLFAVWGIPFCAIGVYLVAGRFWVAGREAERTTYAITDRRVMIQSGAFARRYIELSLGSLPSPQLEARADGIGTITFGAVYPFPVWGAAGWPGTSRVPAFVAIREAGRVFRLLEEARSGAA
jgi:hypothetical protein